MDKFTNEEKLMNQITQVVGVFLVRKLGKRGFSSKERLFIVNETSVAYYSVPSLNQQNKSFIGTLKKIYAFGKLLGNTEDKIFQELGNQFEQIKHTFEISKKSEMQFDSFET